MRWSCQFRTYGGLTWHASAPETVDGPFPESAAYIHLHRAYIAASDKVRFNEPMHGRPRSRDDPSRFTRRVRFFNWAFILWWLISGRCCCEERGILLFFFFFFFNLACAFLGLQGYAVTYVSWSCGMRCQRSCDWRVFCLLFYKRNN